MKNNFKSALQTFDSEYRDSLTDEAWLENMHISEREIRKNFEDAYGTDRATKWWGYWRFFFMACSGLWFTNGGEEWIVSHHLFRKNYP